MWLERGSGPCPGYPYQVSHAGPGAPRTAWGRAAVVVLGVPLGLIGLTVALTVWAPSGSDSAAQTPSAAPTLSEPTTATSPVSTPTTPAPSPTEATADPIADPIAAPTDSGDAVTSTTGQSGRSEANIANPSLDVVWSVDTKDPVFFITVDDNLRDDAVAQAGLQIVRDNQIPITAFLTTNYVSDDGDYFDEVTSFGGSIQNHTVTHPFLDQASADPYFEICTAQERLVAQFGSTPWMMRPPFGVPYLSGGDSSAVESASMSCGVNRIVMWNVVVDNGIVSYNPSARASGDPALDLKPGDIVLFHFWDPKFAEGLQMILDIGRANGLSPAPLEDYL